MTYCCMECCLFRQGQQSTMIIIKELKKKHEHVPRESPEIDPTINSCVMIMLQLGECSQLISLQQKIYCCTLQIPPQYSTPNNFELYQKLTST